MEERVVEIFGLKHKFRHEQDRWRVIEVGPAEV